MTAQERITEWAALAENATEGPRAALAAVQTDVRKAALTEVALKWQWGGWSDALLPGKVGTPTILGTAQVVTDWLRAYAEKEEA